MKQLLNFISPSTFVVIRDICLAARNLKPFLSFVKPVSLSSCCYFRWKSRAKRDRWARIWFTFNKVQDIPRKTTKLSVPPPHFNIFLYKCTPRSCYIRSNQRIVDCCFSVIAINKITTIFFILKKFMTPHLLAFLFSSN